MIDIDNILIWIPELSVTTAPQACPLIQTKKRTNSAGNRVPQMIFRQTFILSSVALSATLIIASIVWPGVMWACMKAVNTRWR